MVIDRLRAGNPGEPMACDAGDRKVREKFMLNMAARSGCVGYPVRRKMGTGFTLANVSRALGISEFQAWNLMLADQPTRISDQHRIEDAAGLQRGSLDKFLR